MTVRGSRCAVRGLLACCLLASAGCLVLGLDRFYDELSLTFDERLLGTWRNDDDDVTVTVERSDWRAYRVTYEQTVESGVLTAYLFRTGDQMFVDLTPQRGRDFGSFVIPVHAVVRLALADDELRVSPLSYDWFDLGLRERTLPVVLEAVRAERDQILLSAGRKSLEGWLTARAADDPAFGPATVFRRRISPE